MNVTRDRENGTIVNNQKNYTEDVIECLGCNPAYTPGVKSELFLNHPEDILLHEKDKKRYQSIAGVVMYLR